MPIDLQPPGVDEFEISIFGPGTGESLVIHLGGGRWMIVDSCQPASYSDPVPLDYLAKLGLDPAECVSTVVITHFHADHIKGMDQVVDVCDSAEVWISSALTKEEAIAYVVAHSEENSITDLRKPGTLELAKILKAIDDNKITAKNAIESRVLYRNENITVTALSPSDEATNQAKLDFAEAMQNSSTGYRKLARKLTPNRCAIALHVETEAGAVLLGADLEVSNSENLGWEAAVSAKGRPRKKACVYKVSHHGSETGHYDPVYTEMLDPDPLALLTTMNSHSLPSYDDVERIRKYSNTIFCTTEPKERLPKRKKVVEKVMKSVVKSRRVIGAGVGHIRLRMNGREHTVELNEHAMQLKKQN